MMPDQFLHGKTAWVTGGVTGTGRAIAEHLSGAGANVAIGSLSPDARLPPGAFTHQPGSQETRQAVSAIRSRGGNAQAFPLDLRDDNSVSEFHEAAVREFGPIEILINAAGICAHSLLNSDESYATWSMLIDVNLNGPFRTIQRCLPAMQDKGWGRIINIGSTAANVGYQRYSAYCASKSGLLGLTRAAGVELASDGITCNVIQPGQLDTVMGRKGSELRVQRDEGGQNWRENLQIIAGSAPQGRLVTVEEIASLALFLCRDEARGITGEAINLAGGAIW